MLPDMEDNVAENTSDNTKKKKKKGGLFLTIIGICVILVGAGFVLYPYVGGYFVQQAQSDMISQIEEAITFAQSPEGVAAREARQKREYSFEDTEVVQDTGDEAEFSYDESTGLITCIVDAAPQSEEDDIDQWFDPSTGEDIEMVQSEADLIPGSTLPPGKRALVLRGMLRIDKIGAYLPIVDGTGATQLRYAVGRWRTGAMLGQEGNCVIAGHRNYTFGTFFNRLNELENGDEIIITTVEGDTYTYIVDNNKITDPGDYAALNPVPGETRISLYTCHPLYVGSHRLIVQGLLVKDDEDIVELEVGGY